MWSVATVLLTVQTALAFRFLQYTPLGPDPQTVNRLNGESFQQDPLVTFNGEYDEYVWSFPSDAFCSGYQYAAFWEADVQNVSIRHATIARRSLAGQQDWEKTTFTDYNQTSDDGHDVYVVSFTSFGDAFDELQRRISLGISHGDGTIHLGFDQHDNPLNYRTSRAGVATNPANITWSPDLFGSILVSITCRYTLLPPGSELMFTIGPSSGP